MTLARVPIADFLRARRDRRRGSERLRRMSRCAARRDFAQNVQSPTPAPHAFASNIDNCAELRCTAPAHQVPKQLHPVLHRSCPPARRWTPCSALNRWSARRPRRDAYDHATATKPGCRLCHGSLGLWLNRSDLLGGVVSAASPSFTTLVIHAEARSNQLTYLSANIHRCPCPHAQLENDAEFVWEIVPAVVVAQRVSETRAARPCSSISSPVR